MISYANQISVRCHHQNCGCEFSGDREQAAAGLRAHLVTAHGAVPFVVIGGRRMESPGHSYCIHLRYISRPCEFCDWDAGAAKGHR